MLVEFKDQSADELPLDADIHEHKVSLLVGNASVIGLSGQIFVEREGSTEEGCMLE